jgi:23S rRNA (cytidine1920-2'-O)/16S rRNA (cytidine1409-2'-O)-methyltransferase
MRLDIYLTQHNNIQSRNKANELIKAKKILVDGKIVTKPSFNIEEGTEVVITQEEFFVSRAAYKLKYFLEEFPIEVTNKVALDIGSSTGGFTQILLAFGVQSVTCVDVGTNQLHDTLKDDTKIIIQENTDIRKFYPNKQYELITCDVSFISILNIIENIDRLSSNKIIILYKPQFEVGREVKRDSKGVVIDTLSIQKCRKEFLEKTLVLGWKLIYNKISQLSGKSGNLEELFYFSK